MLKKELKLWGELITGITRGKGFLEIARLLVAPITILGLVFMALCLVLKLVVGMKISWVIVFFPIVIVFAPAIILSGGYAMLGIFRVVWEAAKMIVYSISTFLLVAFYTITLLCYSFRRR